MDQEPSVAVETLPEEGLTEKRDPQTDSARLRKFALEEFRNLRERMKAEEAEAEPASPPETPAPTTLSFLPDEIDKILRRAEEKAHKLKEDLEAIEFKRVGLSGGNEPKEMPEVAEAPEEPPAEETHEEIDESEETQILAEVVAAVEEPLAEVEAPDETEITADVVATVEPDVAEPPVEEASTEVDDSEEPETPPSPADLHFLFQDRHEEITFEFLTKTVSDHLAAIRTSAADALTFRFTGEPGAYLREHSHNVCRLALFLSWQAGLPEDMVLRAGLAGLLHDAGMARLPKRIIEKDDFLGDDDWDTIEEHPEVGARIAESLEGMDPEIPEIIRQHHEVSDGTGYPNGLDAASLHGLAKVLSLVDSYEALSEPRIRPSESSVVLSALQSSDLPPDLSGEEIAEATPHGAMQAVLARGKQRFDPDLAESFRAILGIYPVGSYVELTGGEIARVISPNRDADTRPVVEIVRVKGGWSPMRPVVSDLLRSRGNEVKRGVARDILKSKP